MLLTKQATSNNGNMKLILQKKKKNKMNKTIHLCQRIF